MKTTPHLTAAVACISAAWSCTSSGLRRITRNALRSHNAFALPFLMGALALIVPRHATAAAVSSMDDIQFWVGTGANRAALIIDWNDGKTAQSLAWGFRWEIGTNPTGEDMLRAIDAADVRLEIKLDSFVGFGAYMFGAGYDLDNDASHFTFTLSPASGVTSDSQPADDHLNYSHFDPSVGQSGDFLYWAYYTNTAPGATPGTALPSSSAWYYSDIGTSNRTLVNGSWDAWTLSGTDSAPPVTPQAALVPEPSATLLLLVAGAGLAARRRRPQ